MVVVVLLACVPAVATAGAAVPATAVSVAAVAVATVIKTDKGVCNTLTDTDVKRLAGWSAKSNF